MKAMIALCLVLALLGCGDATGPGPEPFAFKSGDTTIVIYIEPLAVSSDYARWYATVEKCSGLQGDFAGVKWYVTPHPWPSANGKMTSAVWTDRRIILNGEMLADSNLVKHESLHDVLYVSGWRPPAKPASEYTHADLHPAPPFGLCAPS
ncbi:MAG: hypothetical protein ACREMG_08955 [Gemmatimonadales bacterium]